MADNRSANVMVSVVVEVMTGAWGPECTIAQAEKQAVENALGRLQHLLGDTATCRVVRVASTEVRLLSEGK